MKLAIAFLMLCLSGCATIAAVGGAKLQEITGPDVDAAIELAKAGGDADGLACWEAIKAAMPATGAASIDVKGVASALQAARNVRRGIQAGVDPAVHRNCAVLVLDAQQTALKLGLRVAPLH